MTERGLTLNVYRHGDTDTTAGGITATADRLTLMGAVVDDGVPPGKLVPLPVGSRVREPGPDAPPVVLVVRPWLGNVVHLVPAVCVGQGRWAKVPHHTMMGGNYATTSDSRLYELVQHVTEGARFYGALAVHDRDEG